MEYFSNYCMYVSYQARNPFPFIDCHSWWIFFTHSTSSAIESSNRAVVKYIGQSLLIAMSLHIRNNQRYYLSMGCCNPRASVQTVHCTRTFQRSVCNEYFSIKVRTYETWKVICKEILSMADQVYLKESMIDTSVPIQGPDRATVVLWFTFHQTQPF